MTKRTRREFLASIAATAITTVAGFAITGVRIEETEPTEAERRYAAMLSREQDRLTEQEKYDVLVDRLCQKADAYFKWEYFGNDNRWHSLAESPGIQAGIDAMESYVAGFDLSLLCSGQVNEDRIVEAFTISKVQAQSHRLDALHYVYGNLPECNVDFRIQYGHWDNRIIGTVEDDNEDGSVNVRLVDAVPVDFGGWIHSDGTS